MHSRAFATPSQALYRVFIQPTFLNAPRRLPLQQRPSLPPTLPITPIRTKVYKKVTPLAIDLPFSIQDNKIASRHVNYLHPTEGLQPEISLHNLLSYRSPDTHVVQIQPGDPSNEPTERNPRPDLPVVKIMTTKEIEQKQFTFRQKEREKLTQKNKADRSKRLELSYGIAPNDAQVQIRKMKEFLRQGRKVEMGFAQKRGRRTKKGGMDECEELVGWVREGAEEVPGTKEWKNKEGQVGGVLTLYFEGVKQEKGKETEGVDGQE